jgi:hypothetical protein
VRTFILRWAADYGLNPGTIYCGVYWPESRSGGEQLMTSIGTSVRGVKAARTPTLASRKETLRRASGLASDIVALRSEK